MLIWQGKKKTKNKTKTKQINKITEKEREIQKPIHSMKSEIT